MAKILIVDDSKTSRRFLRNMLEKAGHEIVYEAVNGREGVDKYKELHPDIVTMDITMPVLDGIDAVSEIMDYDKSGIGDINQVIRNWMSVDCIICQVLARTEVHSPIDLTRVGTDNFCIQFMG